MKTILAIGVSAAALFAVSSVASAQSDCVNGWHMIKDQIPISLRYARAGVCAGVAFRGAGNGCRG